MFQFIKGINAKHPTVAFFQRDVLMVDDDMPDAVKQQFKCTLLLWIGYNIKNVNPLLAGTGQQVACHDRLITSSGFQAALGFNGNNVTVRQGQSPVRAMFHLILADKSGPVAVNPSRSTFFLQNKSGGLIIKMVLQRPAGDF